MIKSYQIEKLNMDSRFLKLDQEYAYNLRKEINLSRDSFNKILMEIRAYKLLRKRETVIRNKLKLCLASFRTKLNLVESTFPEEERKKAIDRFLQKKEESKDPEEKRHYESSHHINTKHHQEETLFKPNNERNINDELEEIKRKLARFA